MSTVYAIANQKGGVGKTTTAVNVAACIAEAGYPTLLVDVDPQGNATTGLGQDRVEPGLYDVLGGDLAAAEALRPTGVANLSLLASTPDLAGATVELPRLPGSEQRLREALAPLRERYAYVLLDCPPSLGPLTVNALVFPPLHLNGVIQGLEELRSALAQQLSDMGAALEEKWPPEHEEWASRRNRLTELSRDARSAVQLAASSRRGNLRRYRNSRDLDADYHALQAMERIAFYVEDMTEVLSDAIWRSDTAAPVPPVLGEPLAEATRLTSEAIEVWNAEDASLKAAEGAVETLMQRIHNRAAANERIDAAAALGMALRRILLTIRLDSRPAEA